MTSSSVGESTKEDFSWVMNQQISNQEKLDYLKYPLSNWKEIVFYSNEFVLSDEGTYYQKIVNKILKEEVFKYFKFYREKEGKIDIDLNKYYNVDKNLLTKKEIIPDFYVHNIEKDNLMKLLKLRYYMFIPKLNIPDHIINISIIGEIKSTRKSAHKNTNQLKDYFKYIELANKNLTNEMLILMLIYDESYNLFLREKQTKSEGASVIYGYVPKLYYEDCYKAYNELIDQLKPSINKIEIQNINFKKKISKNELIKRLESSKKMIQILSLIILILSFIIFYIFLF